MLLKAWKKTGKTITHGYNFLISKGLKCLGDFEMIYNLISMMIDIINRLKRKGRERKGRDVFYSRSVSYIQWCYMFILVDRDLLNNVLLI